MLPMPTPSHPQQFVALAGLRGVAALIVVQWHGQSFLGGRFLPSGYLAVDFFFLLSGWVLAHAYDARLSSGMPGWEFMRLRLTRLYPVYALAIMMVLAGWAIGGHPILPGSLLAFLFLPDLLTAAVDWVVGPSWSLSAEIAANLPFAFLHRQLTTPILVAVVLISVILLAWWASRNGDLDLSFRLTSRWGMFPRVFFSFPLGILLYRHRATLARWAPRWATWLAPVLLVGVLAIPAEPALKGVTDLVIAIVGLPLILLFAANGQPGPRSATIAANLASLSYPVYLIHQPILQGMDVLLQVATGASITHLSPVFGAGIVIGVIAIAWLIDRLYDQPIRRWLTRPHRPRGAAQALATSPPEV